MGQKKVSAQSHLFHLENKMLTIHKFLDLVDFIDGDRGVNYPKRNEFLSEGDCLFLNTKNIPDYKFNFNENLFISAEKDNVLRKGRLKRGDYVLTTRGTVGNFAKYDDNVPYDKIRINSGMVILRTKNNLLDKDYLQFILNSRLFQQKINSVSTGSAQPQLPIRDLSSIEFPIPNLGSQKEIVSILSKYDDLIENNEKRIKILEEMAQRLYTEWFVKFKFPGYEKVKMIDSGTEFGMIPEGWKVATLKNVANCIRGKSYSSNQINDLTGEYYLVNLKSFNRGGGFRFDGTKYYTGEINNNQILFTGDLVMAVTDMTTNREIVARPARVPKIKFPKITFSADVVKIISDLPNTFLYFSFLDHRFIEETKNKANGANVLHLKPEAILEHKLVIPSDDLLDIFEKKCSPLLVEIDNLVLKNQNLVKSRDLLIPQLVTGKIEIN